MNFTQLHANRLNHYNYKIAENDFSSHEIELTGTVKPDCCETEIHQVSSADNLLRCHRSIGEQCGFFHDIQDRHCDIYRSLWIRISFKLNEIRGK